jgi:hypothetical protein
LKFDRLGLVRLFEKEAAQKGWFGPTFDQVADEDQLGQILAYNESQERVLVGKSKDVKPSYYYLFITAYPRQPKSDIADYASTWIASGGRPSGDNL